ncbi:MAG: metallophosphoesterase [Myxococcota bacterium]
MQRIFVGDVQGCADELDALLERAHAAFGDEFVLWVAGDLVNRGPDNRRPLERVRALVDVGRAEYVLGNHEIHLISAHFGLRDLSENDSIGDVLAAPDASEWVRWLRGRPLVVPGEVEGQRFAMVHASCGPGWSFETLVERAAAVAARLSGDEAGARAFLAADAGVDPVRDDLARLTRGRAGDRSSWSSREPETPEGAWHRAWAAAGPDYGLVYGHWARQGLHVADGLRGLDTGCVHHGRGRDGFLTAWLPDSAPAAGARPFDAPDDRFWQIPAKRRYYYPSQDRV